tara:strand:+ start:133 stop:687 length:555 start_codon:yes stop_codon:yes gene_type:complete
MAHPAWEWKSEIPTEICDYIVKNLDEDYRKGKVGGKNFHNDKIRNVQISSKSSNWINALLNGFIRYANHSNFSYDLSDIDKEDLQFSKYDEGCFYTRHTDYSEGEGQILKTRKLSLSLQLSDENEYEGGELILYNHLKNNTIKACKSKGSLIIFDSRMAHEITPITSGVRYSLVKWYHGDKPLR